MPRLTPTYFHLVSYYFHFLCSRKLKEMGLQPKALLLLDNCSAHPDESQIVSIEGLIVSKLFPPNVTSLIQPMDSRGFGAMKRRYRATLLRELLLSQDKDIDTFLKEINKMNVIQRIATAWDEISPQTIRRSWRKLVPIEGEDEQEILPSNAEFISTLQTLGYELEGSEVQEWLESDDLGCEHLSDEQIMMHVEPSHMVENEDNSEEDDPTDPQIICPVSNGEAMFDTSV